MKPTTPFVFVSNSAIFLQKLSGALGIPQGNIQKQSPPKDVINGVSLALPLAKGTGQNLLEAFRLK